MIVLRSWAAGVAIAVGVGCQGRDLGEGQLFPASGRVTFDGKPLTEGGVAFYPDASKGNASRHIPRGVVDSQGKFTLKTTTRPGALAGWYKVTVIATKDAPPPKAASLEPGESWSVSVLPDRYANPDKSGLAVEVLPKDDAPYDLTLTK